MYIEHELIELKIFIDCTFPERHISYNQAKTIVRKLIAGFKANGLHTGDTVCLHSSNNVRFSNDPFFLIVITGTRNFPISLIFSFPGSTFPKLRAFKHENLRPLNRITNNAPDLLCTGILGGHRIRRSFHWIQSKLYGN